jgi:ribosomal protection tetracycline resistance protein
LNSGILAHVNAGKTSLAKRLLHVAGVIDEVGHVDDGGTRTDSLARQRRRGARGVGGRGRAVADPGADARVAAVAHPDAGVREQGGPGWGAAGVSAEHDVAVPTAHVGGRVAPDPGAVVAARTRRCAVHPVCFGSAITGAGVAELPAGVDGADAGTDGEQPAARAGNHRGGWDPDGARARVPARSARPDSW